jgi:hypothetical protein
MTGQRFRRLALLLVLAALAAAVTACDGNRDAGRGAAAT